LSFAALIERICGLPRKVQQYAEEIVTLSREHGFPSWLATGTAYLGWSLAALGDAAQGLDLISNISLRRETGAVISMHLALAGRAEPHAALGHPVEALACVNEAVQAMTTDDIFPSTVVA
jgi:hypothetical protein